MKGRGRKAAVAGGAIAALVLAAAAFAFRQEVLERWHLHRLEHGGPETKRIAAEKLAAMKSARAVPLLIGSLKKEIDPITTPPSFFGKAIDHQECKDLWPASALIEIGDPAIQPLMEIYEKESGSLSVAAAWILEAIGPEGSPEILRYMEAHPLFTPPWMVEAVGRMGPDAKSAVPALRDVIRYGSENAVRAAIQALVEIGADDASCKAIRALGEHHSPAVRDAAREALTEIERARPGR